MVCPSAAGHDARTMVCPCKAGQPVYNYVIPIQGCSQAATCCSDGGGEHMFLVELVFALGCTLEGCAERLAVVVVLIFVLGRNEVVPGHFVPETPIQHPREDRPRHEQPVYGAHVIWSTARNRPHSKATCLVRVDAFDPAEPSIPEWRDVAK